MKRIVLPASVLALTIFAIACVNQAPSNSNIVATTTPAPTATPTPSSGVVTAASTVPVTLPVLDALFSDDAFKAELKSKLQLTDVQIEGLRNSARAEVAKLGETNSEQQEGAAAEARDRAEEAIRNAIGAQKADALLALVRERWVNGNETPEPGKEKEAGVAMLPGPNAVPTDTRIVVNIPAYRMDLFKNGSLVKSYKIGIGYPQFPLPTGLRKAQTIIFNPTWTPPDEPWVANMKDVAVGEKVEAGSPLNPLGPIKIPIGMPSLIHGGKSLAKIGTFASHGCVGLTNAQVKDFATTLVRAAGKNVSEKTLASYLTDPTKTKVVKLDDPVPVELRYETIVVEDGKLHIYKDVYDQNTNTEENLRAALQKNGLNLEDFSDAERAQVLEALNAMSTRPQKIVWSTSANSNATPANSNAPVEAAGNINGNVNQNANGRMAKDAKTKPASRKPISKKQKEVVIEAAALSGKGYPGPVDLDTGSGKPARKPTETAAP
ncbi:MAG: L,D-transpeptidase [Acidobacteriota bacterium]